MIADLSGSALTAALEGGGTILKVSHEDLICDGRAAGDDPHTLAAELADLALVRGRSIEAALKPGSAAGTTNVTRKGLATGQRQVVEQLGEHWDRPAASRCARDRPRARTSRLDDLARPLI